MPKRTYSKFVGPIAEAARRRGPSVRAAVATTYMPIYRTMPARSVTQAAPGLGEMKYFDVERTSVALTAITTTWASTNLDPSTTINLGDAAVATPLCLIAPIVSASLNGRIGRKIRIFKVKLRGMVSCAAQSTAATADSATHCRVLLVLDKQTNVAQMVGTDLLMGGGAASSTIHSYMNVNNFGRFQILKDKQLIFGNASMTGAATVIEQSGLMQKLKMGWKFNDGLKVNFNGTNGGTVADIIDNSLHVIGACTSAGLAPSISYYCRVCYKE